MSFGGFSGESCFIISLFQRLSHACIQLAPDLLELGPPTAERAKVRPSSGHDRRLGKQWDIRSAYYDKPPLELRGYNKRDMGVDTHADNGPVRSTIVYPRQHLGGYQCISSSSARPQPDPYDRPSVVVRCLLEAFLGKAVLSYPCFKD